MSVSLLAPESIADSASPAVKSAPAPTGEGPPRFRSRRDSGAALAQALGAYAGRSDVLVLALSPSSVHTAHEVAKALNAPLDLFLATSLTVPGHESLALGAVTTGGRIVLNRDLVTRLGIPFSLIRDSIVRSRAELERRERDYLGDRPPARIMGRTVILVADGVSSGGRTRSVIAALRKGGAARVVSAIPVAPPEICALIRRSADELVCLHTPKPYYGVGVWYQDFSDPAEEETRALLASSGRFGAERV
jgi:putative phosphoribosyl transferase